MAEIKEEKTKRAGSGYIHVKGARVHNLKDFEIKIPRDKFIVVTGLSGSGKSSLAFDTVYAEGQRRYVESLSSYARQFLGRIQKPDVDFIKGIPPAIAIEQKVNSRNPRSTVGTSTEIYDYLKLLYARIGKTFSPVSGKRVKSHSVEDVVRFVKGCQNNINVIIMAPVDLPGELGAKAYLEILMQQGLTRLEYNKEIYRISNLLDDPTPIEKASSFNLVIDRLITESDEDTISRLADSVQTAFNISKGRCLLSAEVGEKTIREKFSARFEADGMSFEKPNVHMFSFNNPLGACPLCEGYGRVIGIDEDLVIPNKKLSIYEDAIVCWRGEKMKKWKEKLIKSADSSGIPIHKPYRELSGEQKRLIWTGNAMFKGLNAFFDYLEKKKYKIQYRVMLSRYRGRTTCPECNGTRLKKEAAYIKINKRSINELVLLSIDELSNFFQKIKLKEYELEVSERILLEIRSRLEFLKNVGLGYLNLNRLSSTLSGGESQRINLATSLGSSLVGSLYILDEPSIGLHPRDTGLLIKVLKELKKLGNTLMVVEHDEEIIRSADHIIDIGPHAGRLGGEIVFQGDLPALMKDNKSHTSQYLGGKKQIEFKLPRRKWNSYIEIKGARKHNLKNIDIKIPLNVLTVVTGVSGSGKSSLIGDIFFPAMQKQLNSGTGRGGDFDSLQGDTDRISQIEYIDQNPIGKSSRSNPVTYLKAWDEIRKLMTLQNASKINNFKAAHFSFNIDGGRCETCQGEGKVKVEMQFMADVELICEDCKGKRFKDEILEVKYRGKNVYNMLEMTVNEAIDFFSEDEKGNRKIIKRLRPLKDVGLGYIKLGQSSSTLSGGESQRVKLASFLAQENSQEKILFIFDEPTTGLHIHDINTLLAALQALIERGHSILIIEHNLDIIKSADWIIDLGPGGGEAGGDLVIAGTPEQIAGCPHSHTGYYLKEKLF